MSSIRSFRSKICLGVPLALTAAGLALFPAGMLMAIPLPDNSSVNSAGTAFALTQTGTGSGVNFQIQNTSNSLYTLYALTNGSGRAGYFQVNNTTSTAQAVLGSSNGKGISLYGHMTGLGRAGHFHNTNPDNIDYALYALTHG